MPTRARDSSAPRTPWSLLALVVLLFIAVAQSALFSRVSRAPGQPVAAPAPAPRKSSAAARPAEPPASATRTHPRPILEALGRVTLPGAEIPAYEPATNCLFVTTGRTVAMLHLGDGTAPTFVREIDVVAAAGFPASPDNSPAGEITHVAIDPAGRGFGAATVIPRDAAGSPGRLVLFSTRTGAPLRTFEAGYGPDACTFAPDGSWIVAANEGEPRFKADGTIVDPPGSITVVRTDKPRTAQDVRSLSDSDASTIGFEGSVLDEALRNSGPDGSGLRISPRNLRDATRDLEPECVAILDGVAYITLQENNGIASYDLKRSRWKNIAGLGQRLCTIDASDRDGGIHIDKPVLGMPMPDQIGACVIDGKPVVITADEGDDRGDWSPPGSTGKTNPLGDVARLADIARSGHLAPGPFSASDHSDAGLGRLHVLTDFSDPDGDGIIDRIIMPGTRSMTVWNAASLERLGDTGDQFERRMALHPDYFNAGSPSTDAPDTRSDDRGPEPEGIAIARLSGWTLAFVSLERPGGVATVDISDPLKPTVLGVYPSARDGDLAPEGLCFIPPETSPTGEPLLAAAFEVSKTIRVFRVTLPTKSTSDAKEPE